MLRLQKVTKEYIVAGKKLEAIKDISLSFRKNEFVSILGPSGCGKTTTLNIVGGLDKYSSGDLFINGISTKEFTAKDWDVYRNHRVGFIFQSYNLIPHQTILANVELSLTIAGLSKVERQKKAKKALDQVGLKDLYHKKPNQLSGGQCQRVAIARALVNEPEILLADEPTGALDTKTSIQIMDLIKEIAKDRLVIMVTHNPDLAEKYSTRIINLLDGVVVSDSNPFSPQDEIRETKQNLAIESEMITKKEKAKMSMLTAFKLSSKNLWTKRKRTILTCIAGSIGIIGISAVLAVSSGVKNYISSMQEDMLSGNPITVTETSLDFSTFINISPSQKVDIIKDPNLIYVDPVLKETFEQGDGLISNNITQDYVDYIMSMDSSYVSEILLNYGVDLGYNIYSNYKVNSLDTGNNYSINTIKEIFIKMLDSTELGDYSSFLTSQYDLFQEAPKNSDYIKSQYDILTGSLATKENELMLVLDEDQATADVILGMLGYYPQDDFLEILKSDDYKSSFTKEEILNKSFTYYPHNLAFNKNTNEATSSFFPFTYNSNKDDIIGEGMELKVVGILQPKDTISYGCLTSGFYYTNDLTKKFMADSLSSELIKFFDDNDISTLNTALYSGVFIPPTEDSPNLGIPFQYDYTSNGVTTTVNSYVGSYVDYSFMNGYMSSIMGSPSSDTPTISISVRQLSKRSLGGVGVANKIMIYPKNTDTKDNITDYLDEWNSSDSITLNGKVLTKDDRTHITYTDTLAIVILMINSIVDVVTYALVAFTALSLVVSCVMIAIITYVSVMERVKEIGVIRSLGGRKKDVSHLFNAETFIIGSISGVFGILMTYLISLMINSIIYSLSGISDIASLPFYQAIIMILLSIILTVLSGLIPAHSAAKKDPAIALRAE